MRSIAARAHRDRAAATLVAVGVIAVGLLSLWLRVGALGWVPVGDNSVIAMRASDVFEAGSPLLGMPSGFSAWSGEADPFHPGPAVFWVMSPWVTLLGTGALGVLIGTWVTALGSAALTVWTGARRLGPDGALGAAVLAYAFVPLSISVDSDIWQPLNPVLAVLPAVAVCFLTWCVLEGDGRMWPFLVASSALVIQAELAYLPGTAALLALAFVGTVLRWRRAVARGGTPPMTRTQLLVTAAVTVAVWSFPAIEALANGGGNVAEGVAALGADVPSAGFSRVLHAAIPSAAAVAILGVPAYRGWSTNRPGRRTLALTALVGLAGALVAQASTPAAAGVQSLYRLPLFVVTGFAWFTLAVLAIDGASWVPRPRLRAWSRRIAVAALVVMVVRTPFMVAADDWWMWETFPAVEALGEQVEAEVLDGSYALQALGGPTAISFGHALSADLEERGLEIRVTEPLARYLGGHRLTSGAEAGTLHVVIGAVDAPLGGAERVAAWSRSDQRMREQVSRRVAAAVRNHPPITVSGTAQPFGVGSVVAATGRDRRHVVGLSDEGLVETGSRLLDDPASLRDLSDASLAALVGAGFVLLREPSAAELEEEVAELSQASAISVWLEPGASGPAEE